MILFPNCKINTGLRILRRRPDGYHDIETVMVPVDWTDVLEIVPSESSETTLTVTGNAVDCPPEKNLVMKAFRALEKHVGTLPPVNIYLRKIIPDGAGLGGGSADAAFTIRGLNEMFNLGLTDDEMAAVVATVGSDCPFFIYNRPMLATGTGTDLEPIELDLSAYSIVIAKPCEGVSTAQAYAGVTPTDKSARITDVISHSVLDWKDRLMNDFEPSVFAKCTLVAGLKNRLYEYGAVYASMSGSGSSVYALFDDDKLAENAVEALSDVTVRKVKSI